MFQRRPVTRERRERRRVTSKAAAARSNTATTREDASLGGAGGSISVTGSATNAGKSAAIYTCNIAKIAMVVEIVAKLAILQQVPAADDFQLRLKRLYKF